MEDVGGRLSSLPAVAMSQDPMTLGHTLLFLSCRLENGTWTVSRDFESEDLSLPLPARRNRARAEAKGMEDAVGRFGACDAFFVLEVGMGGLCSGHFET